MGLAIEGYSKRQSIKRVRAAVQLSSSESPPSPPNMEDHEPNNKSQQSHGPPSFMQDTPPRADVDEILRRKRKAREYKVSIARRCILVASHEGRSEIA